MNKMCLMKISLFCFITFISDPKAAVDSYRYRETTGDKQEYFEEIISKENDQATIHLKNHDSEYLIKADKDLKTQFCQIDNNTKGSRITAKRIDNSIQVIYNNSALTHSIDTFPWYATINSMSKFITSDQKKEYFWMVSADFGKVKSVGKGVAVLNFVAEKKGEEVISCNDHELMALKVTITFADWKSIFWRSQYWFSPSDGIFLKSEQVRGGPGTPKTVVELISGH